MTTERNPLSTKTQLMFGFATVFCLFGGFGSWAYFTEISGAVVASGRIEVDRNRQVVQHLDGGIVAAILVDEGDTVEVGEALILLDDASISSQKTIVEGQLFEHMARRGRLEAERDDASSISFDPLLNDKANEHPDYLGLKNGQTRLFETRRAIFLQESEKLQERAQQISDQIHGIVSQLEALNVELELLQTELLGQKQLLQKGLAQSSRVLELQREEAKLRGRLGELSSAKAQAEGQRTEAEIEVLRFKNARREEAIATLRDVRYRELELAEQYNALAEQLARLNITAPVSGVVYDLNVFAEQSVIRAADPLLYIIPQDRPLIISAQIDPTHIEQVRIGQKAVVRFSSIDQKTTPELNGTVDHLSPDIFSDDSTGLSHYKARIFVDDDELAKLPAHIKLLPGMPVDGFLQTGLRTPLEYLTKPFTDYLVKAFREG